MKSIHKRAAAAFLVAPLAGVMAFCMMMLVLNLPKDAASAPLYVFLMYAPLVGIGLYPIVWIVGIPTYLILSRLNLLFGRYIIGAYAAAGFAIAFLLEFSQLNKPFAIPMILNCTITGAVTGAAFAWMISTPVASPTHPNG